MTTIYDIPGNTKKFDSIYVLLSVDENGEGIVSQITVQGQMPIVFGNEDMVNSVKSLAANMSKQSQHKFMLCKFDKVEVIEEFNP